MINKRSSFHLVSGIVSVVFLGSLVSCRPLKESSLPVKEEGAPAAVKDETSSGTSDMLGMNNPDVVSQRMREVAPPPAADIAGEFFGVPVPMSNYYFAKKAVVTFGAKWRGTPQTKKELEDMVWQELLFSFEAFRRGITASDSEIDQEIEELLKAQKVEFDYRKDTGQFTQWAKETLGLDVGGLRNQVAHLIKLEKLRNQVLDSIEPDVSEEEAYSKFLDEYNTLSVELVQFNDLAEAEEFYESVKKPLPAGALDALIWNDIVASHEAFKRKIAVTKDDVDKAVQAVLREYHVTFKWEKDPDAYEAWAQETFGISSGEFRRRMKLFSRIDALYQAVASRKQPPIDSSAFDAFLKRYKTVKTAYKRFPRKFKAPSKEIIYFRTIHAAEEFYGKLNREPGPWGDLKRRDPSLFKRPGFVALDFLIHMWGFKRNDAYRMLDMDKEGVYPPAPIYRDYAVFKILSVREADPKEFEKRREYYFNRVKMIKKYKGWEEWAKEFKKKADIKVYITQ